MGKNKKKIGNAQSNAGSPKFNEKDNKVIGWILGVLICLGIVFAGISCMM